MQIGDYVRIKDDCSNCIYKIIDKLFEQGEIFEIKGVHYRISRFEKEDNLIKVTDDELKMAEKIELNLKQKLFSNKERNLNKKYLLGTVLHIDGDEEYLKKCIELYDEIGIYSYGKCLKESDIYLNIGNYLLETNPDIVVVTGHDIYNNKEKKDLNNYSNTINFVKAVKEIRKVKNNSCIVIAGACQSNFEALIASGADFASSPGRINIHTFDPAIIAINIATTSFDKKVNVNDLFKYIENGKEAFGGLQTYGKMRLLL